MPEHGYKDSINILSYLTYLCQCYAKKAFFENICKTYWLCKLGNAFFVVLMWFTFISVLMHLKKHGNSKTMKSCIVLYITVLMLFSHTILDQVCKCNFKCHFLLMQAVCFWLYNTFIMQILTILSTYLCKLCVSNEGKEKSKANGRASVSDRVWHMACSACTMCMSLWTGTPR